MSNQCLPSVVLSVLLSAEFLTNHLHLRQTLPVLSNILCQNKEDIFLLSCRLVLMGHWLPASCKVSYYLRARAKVQEHVKWQGQSWASLVHCRYPEIIKHCFPFRRANTEHKHWTAADDGNIPQLPAVGVVPPCLVTCCPLAAAPPLCTMTQSPPPAQDDLNCLRRAKSSAKADS